jgi:hypothetical protein
LRPKPVKPVAGGFVTQTTKLPTHGFEAQTSKPSSDSFEIETTKLSIFGFDDHFGKPLCTPC